MRGMRAKMQAALSAALPVDVVLTGTQEQRIVDAILAAMVEPTEAMVKCEGAWAESLGEDAAGTWREMILEAQREPMS